MTQGEVPSGRVLVVDDSELIREIIEDFLLDNGWDVYVACSGAEALQIFGQVHPEAVVCDLHMPDMDGHEVLARLAAIAPDVPLIMLSAEEQVEHVLEVIREGAFDYVLKSDVSHLQASLIRAVTRYRALHTVQSNESAGRAEAFAALRADVQMLLDRQPPDGLSRRVKASMDWLGSLLK